MIVLSIEKEAVKWKKSVKNGKEYATVVVEKRKEKDKYENTHSVSNSQSKEERAEKKKKEYVGSGKEYNFEKKEYLKPVNAQESEDDLPF